MRQTLATEEEGEVSPSIGLPEATQIISKMTGKPIPYARVYGAVLSGEIAAVKHFRGWRISRADLPKIAALFRERLA